MIADFWLYKVADRVLRIVTCVPNYTVLFQNSVILYSPPWESQFWNFYSDREMTFGSNLRFFFMYY